MRVHNPEARWKSPMLSDEDLGESWLAMRREMEVSRFAERSGLERSEVEIVVHHASGKAFVQWRGAIPAGIVYHGAVMASDPAPAARPPVDKGKLARRELSLHRLLAIVLLEGTKLSRRQRRRLARKLARLKPRESW